MAKQFIVVLASLAILLLTGSALAQDETEAQDEKDEEFNLIVGEELEEEITEELVLEEKFIPAIKPGSWDLTLTLGYFNMNKTLMQHEGIIYKATDEDLYYGDMKLENNAAFNPMLRLGYTLTTWLAIELQTGITFSNYEANITNMFSVSPDGGLPSPVSELGEFDAEKRSSTIIIANLNAVWYFLNMDGDGTGRWHPYVTGGAGVANYGLDSNYVDDPASSLNVNFGVGLKLIADDLISLRFEILYQAHNIQFEPAEYFDKQDSGTTVIPIFEFDENGNFSTVREYGAEDLGGLVWQIGFSIAL